MELALFAIIFAIMKSKKFSKLADDIFFNDMLEKKIAKINERIGSLIYELISKRDEYATKEDVVVDLNGFKRVKNEQ